MKMINKIGREILWVGIVIITLGTAWVLKTIIARGVAEGMSIAKESNNV